MTLEITTPIEGIAPKKPSRKESLRRAKSEKAKIRIEKKAKFRAKTEKKLAEKEKRKVAHKKANSAKKYQTKNENRHT